MFRLKQMKRDRRAGHDRIRQFHSQTSRRRLHTASLFPPLETHAVFPGNLDRASLTMSPMAAASPHSPYHPEDGAESSQETEKNGQNRYNLLFHSQLGERLVQDIQQKVHWTCHSTSARIATSGSIHQTALRGNRYFHNLSCPAIGERST